MHEREMFKEIAVRDVAGGLRALAERMPAQPGVYAWFRGIQIPTAMASDYAEQVLSRASHCYGVPRRQFIAPHLEVEVLQRTNAGVRNFPRFQAACQSEDFRAWMNELLGAASRLLPPLYVGKAGNLQQRIRTHLRPQSELRLRLEEASIALDECTLRYATLPSVGAHSDGLEQEIETLLAYILLPGFSVRYG